MTTENIGEIVIAPRVLEVITGIAATKVEGVYALQNKNVTDSLSKKLLKQLSMIWQKWQFQKSTFTLNLLLLKSHKNQTWLNCLTRIF